MADDLLSPFGDAAAAEGDAVGVADAVVDAVADVPVADFAVGVRDVLVDDDFGAPFPLA